MPSHNKTEKLICLTSDYVYCPVSVDFNGRIRCVWVGGWEGRHVKIIECVNAFILLEFWRFMINMLLGGFQVVSLPARIDPLQTSAVVSLHGRLFVRVPFEQSNI